MRRRKESVQTAGFRTRLQGRAHVYVPRERKWQNVGLASAHKHFDDANRHVRNYLLTGQKWAGTSVNEDSRLDADIALATASDPPRRDSQEQSAVVWSFCLSLVNYGITDGALNDFLRLEKPKGRPQQRLDLRSTQVTCDGRLLLVSGPSRRNIRARSLKLLDVTARGSRLGHAVQQPQVGVAEMAHAPGCPFGT